MRRIVSGDLAVGALLPREADLAAEFDVARSVVREAIKLLEVHGLANPIRRRGTEVLDPLASVSPGVVRAMLAPPDGGVDLQVLRDLLEVRASLDIEMSGLAAQRRNEADVRRLIFACARVRDALGDPALFEAKLSAFTLEIARAAHNQLFVMLVHWQSHVLEDLADIVSVSRPPTEPHVRGVELLLEVVRRGDADLARRVAGEYHDWAGPRILAAAALRSGVPLSQIDEVTS